MKIYCSCCGKQAIKGVVPSDDRYCTTLDGAKSDFGNKVICGHCAKDLDPNGCFPNEVCFDLSVNEEE